MIPFFDVYCILYSTFNQITLVLVLTKFNKGTYLTFKTIFQNTLCRFEF